MDSDISLIEIAGEDDSLLQQIPEDDVLNLENDVDSIAAGNCDYFLCSPLLTVRSDGSNAGSSTAPSTDCADKENVNANNLELPKLSIVPQQMKRKKKGGGYNLRKSLAWNRAFFTDEGVLNPLELSLITGSTSCGETLAAIDEGTPAMSGGDCYNGSSLEDKLLKDTAIDTPSGDRKNGRGLLPKRGSSTKDNIKLKELSVKDVNRGGSKRGSCPRLVAPMSAKRPTTLNTTKTSNNEGKISKTSVPKCDPTVLFRNPRGATIRASARRAKIFNIVESNPKKTTLKAAAITTKSASSKDENSSTKAKTSIQQSRRKLASPVIKVDFSHLHHKPASDSSKALEVATNSLFSKFLPLNYHDETGKASVNFPQNAPPDGGNKLNQIQMAKPSGLRMPSPSMGFFGQKKVASYQSSLQSTSRLDDLSKSNIPNLRSAGLSNPIRQVAPLVQRNFAKAGNVEPNFRHRVKSISEATGMHEGELSVVDACTTYKDLSAHGSENPDVLSLSNPTLPYEDTSGIHDVINDQLAERKPCHESFYTLCDTPKSYYGDMSDLGSQTMPRALDDQLNRAQNSNEQSLEQVECTNSSDFALEQICSDHQRLWTETCNSFKRSRISKDFKHGIFVEDVGNVTYARECCASDKDRYEGEGDTPETHKMRILQTRDVEASGLECSISNECNTTMQSTFPLSSIDTMHIDDEKPPMSNCSSLQGIGFSRTSQHDHASHNNEIIAGGSSGVCGDESIGDLDHSAADAFSDCEPVVRNCYYHTDEIVDIRPHTQRNNIFLELERKQDDREDLAIAYNIEVAESLPMARDLFTSDTENQLYKAQPCTRLEHLENENEPNSHVLTSVNDFNTLPGLVELHNRCIDLVELSQNNDEGRCLHDDLLHTSGSSEDYKEIITDDVMGKSDASKSEGLNNCTRVVSPKDCSSLREETNHMSMDDGILESLVIEAPIRSSKSSTTKSSKPEKVLGGEGASVTMSNEITSEAGTTCSVSTFCSMIEEEENHKPPQVNGNRLCQNENALNGKAKHLIDTEMCSTYDDNAEMQLRNSEDVRKQDNLVIKTSTNVVPFSEEWLAAIEAAGEEILTMKSGAVQNSPPDKSQLEPGPWSPVKRKNNQGIGPYDCTKYTNTSQHHELY